MKQHHNIYLIVLFLLRFSVGFCQKDITNKGSVSINVGESEIFVHNKTFDNWLNANHYKRELIPIGFHCNLSVTCRKSYFGDEFTVNYPNQTLTFIYGRNIVKKDKFYSYFNLDIGVYDSRYLHIIPANCPTIVKDKNEGFCSSFRLKYEAFYLGLSSRNIWLKCGDEKQIDFWNIGLILKIGYMNSGSWQYGYNLLVGKHSTFIGKDVGGIPLMSNFCFSTTIFIGVGG